ncbi:hypothetical protein QMK30_05720 [Streptomyces sp. H27-C3]|nr:hypothetical protein [Streptomyces sp. H27-C3]MDJ0461150.1 hypothetical protein [Streptomyces sp. H27-C3]
MRGTSATHPDTYLQLHALRAAELRCEAAEYALLPRSTQHPIRTHLGWTMVELGLRLAHQPTLGAARTA